MQSFGLVGLLVTIALIGVMFLSKDSDTRIQEHETYNEAIYDAKEAVSLIGDNVVPVKTVNVYQGVSVPVNETELDLSGRNLKGSLKAEVRLLTELKVLDISNNEFTDLPAEVGHLSKLEVLNLSNNPFTGLPHELGNLKNLKTLDLRGTRYNDHDLKMIMANLPLTTEILTD